MKKTLVLASLLAAFGAASAQTSVTISGVLDQGFIKASGSVIDPTATSATLVTAAKLGRGDNNRINFAGVEALGGGMSGVFNLGLRFDADTGNAGESGGRPLFQGESRVGLRGGFGEVKIGRGLTAVQDPNGAYDAFGVATVGTNQGYLTAGYNSDPSQALGAGAGRWANSLFYTSNSMGGLVIRTSFGLKEGAAAFVAQPISLSANYAAGAAGAFLGYEKNSAGTKYTQLAGSFDMGAARLMASIASQKALNGDTARGVGFGAVVPVGANAIKAGYARRSVGASGFLGSGYAPATGTSTAVLAGSIFSIGYQHNLSTRTYIYTDFANETANSAGNNVVKGNRKTTFDLGLRHAF